VKKKDNIATLFFYIIVIVFVLNPMTAYTGQTPAVIFGSIRDAETNKPLPAAQIHITGTRIGTITNDEGDYHLEIPDLPAEIVVSFIGYESAQITVTATSPETLDVLLKPRLYILPTVTVTSGSTAEIIMRRVIERKKEWYASLNTYKVDAYTRVNLANETKIAFISESISVLFWDKEQGTKEVTTFRKNTDNIPDDMSVTSARMVPNFYDDNVVLFGYNMVGLTHPDALDYYTFKIIEHSTLDNKTVYIMSVEPKSKLQPLFRGTVSILDEDYAMIDLDLRPNEAVIYPSPLNEFKFSVKQQFSNFGEDVWLPVDVRVNGKIKIKFGFLLELPAINYSQVSRFSDYEINTALPDSLFKNKQINNLTIAISNDNVAIEVSEETRPAGPDISETEEAPDDSEEIAEKRADETLTDTSDTADSTTVPVMTAADSLTLIARDARRDSLFALNRSAIPFTAEEDSAYAAIDSTMTMEKMFKPTGLLTKVVDMENSSDDSNTGDDESETKEKSRISRALSKVTSGMTPGSWHNRVDGYHLGMNWNKRYKKRIRYHFGGAYSTALERWSWNVGTELFPGKKERVSFILSAFSGTDTRQNTGNYPLWLNTALTLGGFNDYYDYFWNERLRAGIKYRFNRKNMEIETAVNSERHESLAGSSYFDLSGKRKQLRANPAVKEGALRSVSMRFNYGRRMNPVSVDGPRGASFSIEHSSPAFLGGLHTFTSYNADIVWRVETYLKRRLFPMTLDIRFTGSASTGKLPIQRFASLDSRFLIWTPFGTFKSLGTRPLEGEHHAALFVEHNFRTVPFELIGLRRIAEKNIGIIVHGAAGRTWISSRRLKELAFTPHYRDTVISEAGISLNNLFGFLRLDYTKRLDRRGHTFGINLARIM
jgi:hypothetical protein